MIENAEEEDEVKGLFRLGEIVELLSAKSDAIA
jgi:hypothetical protein